MVRSGLAVIVMDCQPRGSEIKSRPGQEFASRLLRPLAKSAMMRTGTVHCQREDETTRERTDHPPSCAEAKKMKSLTQGHSKIWGCGGFCGLGWFPLRLDMFRMHSISFYKGN